MKQHLIKPQVVQIMHVISLMLMLIISLSSHANEQLRLVTTTSTDNSGLMSYLLPAFEAESGIDVHVIAVGTGKALAIAGAGDADVLMVHAKSDELAFISQGLGIKRYEVMYNEFVIAGPAPFDKAKTAEEVFRQIAASQSTFVSRGDNSGTHKRELALWERAGITPGGRWYLEAGQGMGKTLQIASELGAYVLTDRGTWLAQYHQNALGLKIIYQKDELLFNPYGVIAVNPEKFPHVNHQGAQVFINWLISPVTQKKIAAFKINGEQLFFPSIHSF